MDMNNDVKKKEPNFYESLHVTPLVEIFNISVKGNGDDVFRVYGEISVIDRGRTFSIYNRTKDSPQFMVSDDKLLLTVEDDLDNAVIIPSDYASLKVKLFAISGHEEITLEGKITLKRTTGLDDWSEEYKTGTVAGKDNNNWNAEVQYAIFPYAVAATVRIMHFSKDDDFDCFEEIVRPNDGYYETGDELDITDYEKHSCSDITKLYGSVHACAAVCCKDDQMSSLFSKQVQECVQVQSGRCIDLSRSVVAVPAYSSLKIKVSFFDGNNASLIASDTVEFKPIYDRVPYKKDIVRDNGRIRVQVLWSYAYGQLYSRGDDSFNKQRVRPEQEVVSKEPSTATLNDDCSLPEHNSSETYSSNCVLPSSTRTEPLLELFSAVVCSKDSEPFKFYGSIFFASNSWPNHIFKRDESCPLECPTSGMPVILKGPEEHENLSLLEDFALIVDIKDASSQAAISRGLIPLHTLDKKLLANRRICSVFRGELGFAVVHYSIFSKGVAATVDIKLSGKCLPAGIIIKGEICAVYGNCEPGRCYQDKFYKNLLFFDEDGGVRLDDSKPTLPLLKPLLSLPIESFLIIEADLLVSTVDDSLAEGPKPLKGKIKFFNNGDSPQQIGNGDLWLDVSVHFSRPI